MLCVLRTLTSNLFNTLCYNLLISETNVYNFVISGNANFVFNIQRLRPPVFGRRYNLLASDKGIL